MNTPAKRQLKTIKIINPIEPFSFLKLAKSAAENLPIRGRTGDKVTDAKKAISNMISLQKNYLCKQASNIELPKTKSGSKTVSTWFRLTNEGYWTNIRWGMRSLKLGNNRAWLFQTASELNAFYDAVATAIEAGELDKVIEAEASKSRD